MQTHAAHEPGDRRTTKPSAQINVTPLIDVLLVLLIIFMVITPLHPARFKALVPEEPTPLQNVTPDPLTLVVTVDRDSRLKLNRGDFIGTTTETTRLTAELAEQFKRRVEAGTWRSDAAGLFSLPPLERIERTVFIKAPRSLRYGEVARVVDALKGVGANPIGLQIDDLEP